MKIALIHKAVCIGLAAALLLGCTSQQAQQAQTDISNFAALSGQTIMTVGGIAVAVECSSIPATASTAAGSVINIVAPNSSSAQEAATDLAENAAIAATLCPLYKAIQASVGTPTGTPSTMAVPATASFRLRATGPQLLGEVDKPIPIRLHEVIRADVCDGRGVLVSHLTAVCSF